MRLARKAKDDRLPAPAPAPAPEGILYASSGQSYVAEAVRSARSSLTHNALPHLLFASGEAEPCDGLTVERFEPSAHPFADKIASMRRSPFERTIYLDSDTFVTGEIGHLLRLLDRYDIAVAYAPADRGLADPEVPQAFYEFNTGVIAWRANERTASFMAAWEATYLAWLERDPFPVRGAGSRGGRADQLAFRRCAWQHDVHLYALAPEYNFRLGYPQTVVDSVRVIHGRHSDYPALAASLNGRLGPRSWPPPPSQWQRVSSRVRRTAQRATPPAAGAPGSVS